jgi:hypothetical protein
VPDHSSYIREKLRGAKNAILDDDRPMQERLCSAYLYSLSSLQREWFPDADAQNEFQASSRSCASTARLSKALAACRPPSGR